MATTPNITPSPTTQPLFQFVWNFLQVTEAVIPRVYSDSLGIPTLGVGYALIVPGPKGWIIVPTLKADLSNAGINLSPADLAQLTGTLTTAR